MKLGNTSWSNWPKLCQVMLESRWQSPTPVIACNQFVRIPGHI